MGCLFPSCRGCCIHGPFYCRNSKISVNCDSFSFCPCDSNDHRWPNVWPTCGPRASIWISWKQSHRCIYHKDPVRFHYSHYGRSSCLLILLLYSREQQGTEQPSVTVYWRAGGKDHFSSHYIITRRCWDKCTHTNLWLWHFSILLCCSVIYLRQAARNTWKWKQDLKHLFNFTHHWFLSQRIEHLHHFLQFA